MKESRRETLSLDLGATLSPPLTEKLWSDPKLRAWGEERIAMGRLATPADMAARSMATAPCTLIL